MTYWHRFERTIEELNKVCENWFGIDYDEYLALALNSYQKTYCKQNFNPLQIIKYCQNYNYQSCDIHEWDKSKGQSVMEYIKSRMIDKLSFNGKTYDEMDWGYNA